MKLSISIVISALALTCTALPTDVQTDKCALCSEFVEMMSTGELESVSSEYAEFLDADNLASCLASCNTAFMDDDTSTDLASDNVEFLSMVGCTTCTQMIQGVIANSYGYDYASIRRAVKHSCSTLDGMIKKARCNVFVKSNLSKIVDAVFHYHTDPQAACIKLSQC